MGPALTVARTTWARRLTAARTPYMTNGPVS